MDFLVHYCTILHYFLVVSIFPRPVFVPVDFIDKVFNEPVITNFFKVHNGHSKDIVIRKSVNDTQSTKRNISHICKV